MGPRLLPRLAAGFTAAAALLVVVLVLAGDPTYVAVVGIAIAVVALGAAGALWQREGLTSRALVVAASIAMTVSTLAVTVVGLPGTAPRPFDGAALMLLAFGIAAPALLSADRPRGTTPVAERAPYAL